VQDFSLAVFRFHSVSDVFESVFRVFNFFNIIT
jgi:hypothetical protein